KYPAERFCGILRQRPAAPANFLLEVIPMFFAVLGIEDLIPLMVLVGIVAAIWAVLSMISNRNSQALDRLSRLSRPASLSDIEDPTKAGGKKAKFQGLTNAVKSLSKPLMPQTETEQSALKIKLANAGFRSDA